MPYTPGTTRRASHSRPSSWRSFAEAWATYQARPDFFDGIEYCFSKDDPYVGGDQDHDLSTDRIPPTYAEISPSGTGIKFIARATGDYGRKTKRGELYSSKRFFTITGNVLPGHEAITPCQEAIEAFAASLGAASTKATTDGIAGSGSRAELVKLIPAAEWDAARHLLRTQINRLLARVRAAAKEETQLAYLLRGDYENFHKKWSFVGLYRGDGSLDESQVRAVAATGIKGRGFTFPEYAALMSHLYSAKALAKWGTRERWREELAALWHKAAGPRFAPKPAPRIKAPRGRAGDHQALVERVYQLLQDHRAGAQAIVQIADLAEAIGTHRRTVTTILNELRAKDRISTKRHGQYGGLIITFSDVIYSTTPEAAQPTAAWEIEPTATLAEETKISNCVSSDRAEADHISESADLAALAAEYLAAPPAEVGKRIVSAEGVVTYRRTAQHFADCVCATHPSVAYGDALAAYRAEQERLRQLELEAWRLFFAQLKAMTNDELIAYIGGRCHAEVAELAREKHDKAAFDIGLYKARLKVARQHLAWRGLTMPTKRTRIQVAAEQAQHAVRERIKAQRKAARPVACQPVRYEPPTPPDLPPPPDEDYAERGRTMAARFRANPPQRVQVGAV